MDRWGLLGWIISLKTATNTKSPVVLKTWVFYSFSRSILQTNSNYCNVYDSNLGNFSFRRLGRKIQWYLEAWGSGSIIPVPTPLPLPSLPDFFDLSISIHFSTCHSALSKQINIFWTPTSPPLFPILSLDLITLPDTAENKNYIYWEQKIWRALYWLPTHNCQTNENKTKNINNGGKNRKKKKFMWSCLATQT